MIARLLIAHPCWMFLGLISTLTLALILPSAVESIVLELLESEDCNE